MLFLFYVPLANRRPSSRSPAAPMLMFASRVLDTFHCRPNYVASREPTAFGDGRIASLPKTRTH